MGSVLTGLVAVEVALSVLAVGVLIWRGLLGMKEDDHLVLSKAEAHLEREQAGIRQRSNTADRRNHVASEQRVVHRTDERADHCHRD